MWLAHALALSTSALPPAGKQYTCIQPYVAINAEFEEACSQFVQENPTLPDNQLPEFNVENVCAMCTSALVHHVLHSAALRKIIY